MTLDAPTFIEFIRDTLGSRNWVVARRTTRILCKYGDDVVCISSARYREIHNEFKRLHPDA